MIPRYQAFYCEENVWHLCREPELAARERRVAFVSSPSGACALFAQRAAPEPGGPVLWAYHVVLFVRGLAPGAGWEAWDLDTTLGFPVPVEPWMDATFPADRAVPPSFRPRFRLVTPGELEQRFSSDRSHMRDDDGSWRAPPPPWPPIVVPGSPSTLMDFVDTTAPFVGEVTDLEGLRRRLNCAR